MFEKRQTYLERALLSALTALLLLTTAGQSAVLSDNLQTTAAPARSNSSLTTQLNNSNMDEPHVQRSFRPCGIEHASYCKNDGECMYPQDNDQPSCICTSLYRGPRCMIFSDHTRTLPELEKVIGITFGILMVFFILGIIIFCFAYKKCVKSAQLIKSEPSAV